MLRAEHTRTQDHPETFVRARRLTTWHYQWLILHEFLPLFIGQALVDDLLTRGRRIYTPRLGEALIPVEFSGAAYRFGHSMVRPSYRANLAGAQGSRSSASSSTRRRTATPIRTTCAAVRVRHAVSRAGKPSSISATDRSNRISEL